MKLQKTISVLTALLLTMQCAVLPAWAESAEPVPTGSYQINPIGSDLLPEDLPEPEGEQGETLFVEQAAVYYTTVEDAADAIMDAMKRREAAISVGVTREVYDILNSADLHPHNVLFNAACEHDPDDPTAGDYHGQLYHYWQSESSWYGNNHSIVYNITYRTTLAEEQLVDAAVAELVAQWTAADMKTYETICTIYDYITENVVYDYAGLDAGDLHVYTAYKGLIEGDFNPVLPACHGNGNRCPGNPQYRRRKPCMEYCGAGRAVLQSGRHMGSGLSCYRVRMVLKEYGRFCIPYPQR